MQAGQNAILVYDDIPASESGPRVLLEHDPAVAWEKLSEFLDACCEIQQRSASLRLCEMLGPLTKPKGPASFFRRRQASVRGSDPAAFRPAATRAFGHPNRIYTQIADDGSRTIVWDWPFDPARMMEALLLLTENLTSAGEGTLEVALCHEVRFLVKDLATGEPLPRGGAESHSKSSSEVAGLSLAESRLVVRLARRSTCSLALSLPFDEVTDAALALIGRLQAHLPFPLSPQRWVLR